MSKNGMAGGLSTKNFRMSLSHLPDPKTKYIINFPSLNGGLNIYDLDYRLDANESPDVRNLHWRDGALGCRSGQEWVSIVERGTTYACYERDFWDMAFAHIDDALCFVDPSTTQPPYCVIKTGVPRNSGVFFRYGDYLMYKNRGGYYKIVYTPPETPLTPVTDCFHAYAIGEDGFDAYAPITYTAMNPATHAGTSYQPENRLSPKKTLWYSAVSGATAYYLPVTGTASSSDVKEYSDNEGHTFTVDERANAITLVKYLDTSSSMVPLTMPTSAYSFDHGQHSVVVTDSSYYGKYKYFVTASIPELAVTKITVSGEEWLPSATTKVTEHDDNTTHTFTVHDRATSVVVSYRDTAGGAWTMIPETAYEFSSTNHTVILTEATYYEKNKYQIIAGLPAAYTVDQTKGLVQFTVAPPYPNPFEANTVHITYSKDNEDAYNSVMDCDKAIVYGANQNLCVVVAGCPAQPNAYFWNGNNIVMDPGYFPMEQYNLAGDTEEKVTGFGKQQGFLVIFKERGIGCAELSTTTIASGDNARLYLQLPYTAINSTVGCDLPGSIQLIKNNLVFCNSKSGVYLLSDSSAADENNVIDLSRKVNGGISRQGLLHDISASGASVHSTNFHENYWLVVNGHAYLWDYELSDYSDPTWFYYTNINSRAMFQYTDTLYHFDGAGRLTKFTDLFSDYNEPIEKVYQFATQFMSTYANLKNVVDVIFVVRSDTGSETKIKYITDYEERYDLTPIRTMSWSLAPRNMKFRYLGVSKFATVAKRKPFCRHVRHFTMRLENNVLGSDLSVISAQVFYNYQGVQR